MLETIGIIVIVGLTPVLAMGAFLLVIKLITGKWPIVGYDEDDE